MFEVFFDKGNQGMEQHNNSKDNLIGGAGDATLAADTGATIRQDTGKIFPEKRPFPKWELAAKCLTPWGKPGKDDYDFRSWMKGTSEEHLNAGCLYEYASESQDFRCWLVLRRTPREERFRGVAMDGV